MAPNPAGALDRGSVWLVDLNPRLGHEQGERRPAVIVSATSYNRSGREMVAVVPCTKTIRRTPFFVEVRPPDGGLWEVSYIQCDQVRTISTQRLMRRLGTLSEGILRIVDARIRAFLDV